MEIYNVTEAKANLSAILAGIEANHKEVILSRGGKPIAKVVPYVEAAKKNNRIGAMKGKIWVAPDYDEWPEDIARYLGIID